MEHFAHSGIFSSDKKLSQLLFVVDNISPFLVAFSKAELVILFI
jgi:hypothetical protein